jgi:cytoskeletal protein CcmA (bactofilin family)
MDAIVQPSEGYRPTRPAFQANGATPAAMQNGAAVAEEDLMSVIGNGILVSGNIEAQVDLQIEGRVQGDVHCATLILGERGSVLGNIFAERVRISGTVEGGVETVDLAIEATARVKGDVIYSRLRIANGGIISGSMTHKPLAEGAAPAAGNGSWPEAQSEAPPKVHYIED